jgi:predicted ATP-grasp superfamily ATP-dependent carboligase
MTGPRVVIVGASGRAAAASARRAGWVPAIVDLFADRDTQLLGETIRCPLEDYPHEIPKLVRRLPPGRVMYTGGLENHPAVIERLTAERELLGNGPAAVERVRDQDRIRQTLEGVGWDFPRRFDSLPVETPCLVKQRFSSGGLGVRSAVDHINPDEYFEEFIPGRLLSAQFHDTTLLGLTEQLAGELWLHAPPFHYAGNIGPIAMPELEPILSESARRLSLRGPWGIDFIYNESGAYLLEVNPRYTAAVEVLELARGNRVGKVVYYAPFPLRFPACGPWDVDLATPWDPIRLPRFADIPGAGEPFRPGQPVLTFFAADSTSDGVRAKLMETARSLDALFTQESVP